VGEINTKPQRLAISESSSHTRCRHHEKLSLLLADDTDALVAKFCAMNVLKRCVPKHLPHYAIGHELLNSDRPDVESLYLYAVA